MKEFLPLLTLLLVALKGFGFLNISWWIVFLPVLIPAALISLVFLVGVTAIILEKLEK